MNTNKTLGILILLMMGFVMYPIYSSAAKIEGTVTYDGEIPNFKEIKMEADPICLTHHDKAVFPQILVLGENKTVGNVFVQISRGLPEKEYPVPEEPVVLDQKGCMYDPHVLGIRVGQPLKILNPDGTLHNVHGVTKINKEFNIAMPKFRKELTKVFDKPEFMLNVKCDVHPWMGAWITVLSHPYFDVTEADGKFEIDNLPAGDYEVQIWHEKLGSKEIKFSLSEEESKEFNVTLSKP